MISMQQLLVGFAVILAVTGAAHPQRQNEFLHGEAFGEDETLLVTNLMPRDAEESLEHQDAADVGVNIINGSFASIGEFPYTVLTFLNGRKHCGGSLIGHRYVLTAAHCFKGMNNRSTVSIRVNELDVTRPNQTRSRDYTASQLILHPNYIINSTHTYANDVCLIILNETVEYNLYVQPILLAKPEDGYFVGDEATQSGWGQTEHRRQSNELRKLNTRVVSQEYCIQQYKKDRSHVDEWHICTYTPQRASCYGDSGSPLVAHRKGDGHRVQIGVVSWAKVGCYTTGYPTVYARVSYLYMWITKTIQEMEQRTI